MPYALQYSLIHGSISRLYTVKNKLFKYLQSAGELATSYLTLQLATPHPTQPRHTQISYATPHSATPYPD